MKISLLYVWVLLGLVATIGGAIRARKDPRLVKGFVLYLLFVAGLATVCAMVFAMAAREGWDGFVAVWLGCAGMMLILNIMIAPVHEAISLLEKFQERRKANRK
ncbi:MAG: hypothetical protein HZC54_01580 [Verrucomicrobia bacterium]|nr:hypothetical protein [Verrucomicrobiota bacterium]